MASLGAILGLKRPLMDREHRLLKPRPTPIDALMCTPVVPAGAKRRATVRSQRRRALQRRSRLIDGFVDALVTQPHRRLAREASTQLAADLLRTPSLRKKIRDEPTQLGIRLDAASMLPSAARRRVPMGVERAITTPADDVAAQFARDRRGSPPEPHRDLPDAQPLMLQVGNLDTFILRKES